MPQSKLYASIIASTPDCENIVATAAKLCYSGADIFDLQEKITNSDQSDFLKKLIDMNHYSPIEHCNFTFAIQGVSRALLAQLTRHRLASFSVKSQRYVDHAKNLNNNIKQEFNYIIPNSIINLGQEAVLQYKNQMSQINSWYIDWTDKLGDNKREDARFVLPNAAETKLVMTVNARELFHIFELRCCHRAQWEIRALSWNMLGLCIAKAPELFAQAGPVCCFKPCDQGAFSCKNAREIALKLVKLKAFICANLHTTNNFESLLSDWSVDNIK